MITTQDELVAALRVGGEIHCDSGVVIPLTETMRVTVPCRIIGGHFTREAGAAFEVTTSRVEFDGVRIEGGGPDAGYDVTQKLIHVRGSKDDPITGVDVHGCRLEGSRGDNVWLEWCTACTVHDNMISRFLYSGIMVISGNRLTINGNVIADAPLTAGVPNTYGIALTDVTNVAADRSRHITVVGNHVSLIDWEGIDTHGGESLTITGNTVLGCPRGIALITGNATRVLAPTHCLVTGNVIDVAGARRPALPGIFLAGISGTPASATIVGNQIVGYRTPIHTSFWSRGETYIGNNSAPQVPWSPIRMGADYHPDAESAPQYLVDGDTVHLRGGVIPKAGGVSARVEIGSMPDAVTWPTQLTHIGHVKGADPEAGDGTLAVTPEGALQLLYGNGSDTHTYFLTGSYRAP
ncbi:right-handed parallel beta-helix repeat-containing protein [Actinophytocola sp.]|uniref:right-handed parallel beta-helix repeat-containing protein n=1 Tax=Actinophytocola sp. TaxID=1872138 RepID=UPI003D6B5D28